MLCSAGVHEEVGHLVSKRVPESERASVRVLDLGAGSGALIQRMLDFGFTDVTAWELNPDQLTGFNDIAIEAVNLDDDFGERTSVSGKFGIVLAVEVIEHLENPYHFARQLKQLLAPEGFAIITTPSVESAASRIAFLRTGSHRRFGDYGYREFGHITPLTIFQLSKALERAELQIVEQSHNLHGAIIVRDPGPLATYRAALAAVALYPLMLGNRDGDIHVVAAEHVRD
ncbi:MAG: class I SAM-dependent methyltransferase [Acidimicrobiales bacterium]|jgi:2-polyprenyl-3-methyl-5-hydroxy-6-metoxy-1,4-benzoquinol methylase